jgi:HNH endonuclease.
MPRKFPVLSDEHHPDDWDGARWNAATGGAKKDPPIDEYPEEWGKRSLQLRSEMDWRCEGCGKYFGHRKKDLHVHHINRNKGDCSRENLRVLCKSCHEKQEGHFSFDS